MSGGRRGGGALVMPVTAPAAAPSGRPMPESLPMTAALDGPSWGTWLVLAMLGIVAIKIHELVPMIAVLRPALLVTGIGTAVLLIRTPPSLIRQALDRPVPKLVLAYLAWCVLTIPTSVWPSQSIDSVLSLVPLGLLVVALITRPPTAGNTDFLQFWWVILFAAYGLLGRAVAYTGIGRLRFGFTYDSNDIAALMAMGFPLALGISLRSSGRRRLVAIIATIICVATIVETRSRGGFVGLVAAAVGLAIATHGHRRVKILFVLAVGAVLTWTMASPQFRARMRSITNLENDYNTTSEVGRKAVWARGRQYIRENPVLGVGVGNFSTAEGNYWTDAGMHAKWSNAHNAYVQAYAELGIPGGTIFVAILATGFVLAWRFSRGVAFGGRVTRRPEYFSSVSAFAVTAIFLSHAYFTTFFALVAFLSWLDHAAALDPPRQFQRAGLRPTVSRTVRVPGQRGGYAYRVVRDG